MIPMLQWTANAKFVARQILLVFACCAIVGCGTPRQEIERAELLDRRDSLDAMSRDLDADMTERLIQRMKAKHDAYEAGERDDPPTLDILVISGGGDRGAFGAAFLKAWGDVDDPEMKRPKFDVVTGVSAGALIAPFAFLGDEESHQRVVDIFRHPKGDWARLRGLFFFMPYTESLLVLPGLEREIEENLDHDMVRALAAVDDGRALKVSTTNVDLGVPRVWDLTREARRAIEQEDLDRVLTILLASNALPGAFPPRIIDGSLYVDGGVTGNILYGHELRKDGFLLTWLERYPHIPPPRMRYWVIFNNKYRPAPQVTRLRWFNVVDRSTTMSTRAATKTAMRHLHALAEIARLKHGAAIEVRIASIPSEWVRPAPGRFNEISMNDMANIGERMGADPASWSTDPPP